MRRFILLLTVMVLGLAVACGGGDDDGPNDGGDSGGAVGGSSSSSGGGGGSGNDVGGSDNGGGGSASNFCSPTNAQAIFGGFDPTGSTDLEGQFKELRSGLNSWKNNAPNDIGDEVELIVNTMSGFIDLLEENDFDVLALGSPNLQNDPRLLALEGPAFEAATDRVSEYCGFEDDGGFFGGTGGGNSTGSGGSTGGGFSVDLPEDFPADLVPPNSTVSFATDAAFGTTVEFATSASVDEVSEFYIDLLGPATFADSESRLWSTVIDDIGLVSVNVTAANQGDGLQVLVIIVPSG